MACVTKVVLACYSLAAFTFTPVYLQDCDDGSSRQVPEVPIVVFMEDNKTYCLIKE